MKQIGTILLVGGLLLAVLTGLLWHDNNLIPWLTAGCGLGVGVIKITSKKPDIATLLGLTGLVLAIYVIETQWYNPDWLNNILLYLRVFVSHALLGAGALAFLKLALPAKE